MKENLIYAESDEKSGILSEKNEKIIPFEYDSLKLLNNNLILADKNDKYGVIDKNNNIVIPLEYEEIELKGDYIYVTRDNLQGIYDLNGKEIIPVEYDGGLLEFSENGLISAVKNYKYGVLNKDNEIVIDFKYDLIWKFLKVD